MSINFTAKVALVLDYYKDDFAEVREVEHTATIVESELDLGGFRDLRSICTQYTEGEYKGCIHECGTVEMQVADFIIWLTTVGTSIQNQCAIAYIRELVTQSKGYINSRITISVSWG